MLIKMKQQKPLEKRVLAEEIIGIDRFWSAFNFAKRRDPSPNSILFGYFEFPKKGTSQGKEWLMKKYPKDKNEIVKIRNDLANYAYVKIRKIETGAYIPIR